MDNSIDRHVMALPRGGGRVYLAWRLLETDRTDAAFIVQRRPGPDAPWQQVGEPVTDSTNYLDATPAPGAYEYRILDESGAASQTVGIDSGAAPSIRCIEAPLAAPSDGAWIVGLGELNNDRRIGYLVPAMADGQSVLFAYGHDGRLMWQFPTQLPHAASNAPFAIWDINADGRTEVVARCGGGGWADEIAAVRAGGKTGWPREPEKFTVRPGEMIVALDGRTGQVVWQAPLSGDQASVKMVVARINGPDAPAAVIVQTGTYKDVQTIAYDGRDGSVLWRVTQSRGAGHNIDAGDIDGDGRDEILCGGICYDADGRIRWSAEDFGHTDISKPAKIDPSRDGLQIWYAVEDHNPGVYLVDKDGTTIFSEPYRHAHYGWLARHAPGIGGLQPHTAEDARAEYGGQQAGMRQLEHNPIFLPDGSHWLELTEWQRKNFCPVHWDEGPQVVFVTRKQDKRIVRLLADGRIEDVPDSRLPEDGRFGRNLGCADVIGDFRENIVTVDERRNSLIVLANPNLATTRGLSPYTDPAYRHDRSQHGGGYYIYVSPPQTTVNR